MPRHYTDEEKRLVLDRLIANNYDVGLTADKFRLPTATIYRWMNAANVTKPVHSQLQQQHQLQHFENSDSPRPEGEGQGVKVDSLPPETTEAFQALHDKLLILLNTISDRIEEAIDDAPLNQRVSALSQLMNTISKIVALLPEEEEEIEYVHEYEYEVEGHVEKKEEAEDHNSPYQDPTED
ncbi:MAG: hypothetical protein GC179_24965 [Anaerolineaceae bacterium]|nr:hypothetical protein [Anaerolineaceae bacterium]